MNGDHYLQLLVALISPVPLTRGALKQTWAISTGDEAKKENKFLSEVYSCMYVPKATRKWKCNGGVVRKSLKSWFNEPLNKQVEMKNKLVSKKPAGARV
jgi:hypothetical protein